MPIIIRPADINDLSQMTTLLLADAEERCTVDPGLWKLGGDARENSVSATKAAMVSEAPPFRQRWIVAESEGTLVGVTHSILLPVPPIYAGELGPPGLIMEDCYVAPNAPPETRSNLLSAALTDLIDAGAMILLASSVEGGLWEEDYANQDFEPLTMYFAKTGLAPVRPNPGVRQAAEDDVPDIVTSGAIHRKILVQLNALFWKSHTDADNRFASWMKRSLTLQDRDMFVSKSGVEFRGYAISQPATPLHFPTPHDILGIGVIDDFYHEALERPEQLGSDSSGAAALLETAEAARQSRGDHSVLVVCPAAWDAKISLLTQAGYSNAITWHIKVVS